MRSFFKILSNRSADFPESSARDHRFFEILSNGSVNFLEFSAAEPDFSKKIRPDAECSSEDLRIIRGRGVRGEGVEPVFFENSQ